MLKHHYTYQHIKQNFYVYLKRSFAIHVAIILIAFISTRQMVLNAIKLKKENLELVQASVRVDMVAMPKFTLAELKNISSGVEEAQDEKSKDQEDKTEAINKDLEIKKAAQIEADKEAAFLEESKKKRSNFLSKLKEIGSKDLSDKNKSREKGMSGENSSKLKNLVLAGNKLSTGVQIYGSGQAKELTQFQAYVATIPDRVRPHWRLPSFLIGKNLRCRVRVWLNLDGSVRKAEVYESSGNQDYDQRAVESVYSAAPYPTLKEEVSKRALNGDILLGFPL